MDVLNPIIISIWLLFKWKYIATNTIGVQWWKYDVFLLL